MAIPCITTTSWSIALVAVCALAACSRPGSAAPGAPPVRVASAPSVPFLPPGTDLTGTWASDSTAEPAIATITVYPGCAYNPAVWIIKQTGNTIEAWAFAASYNQGIATKGPGPARVAASPGQISGLDVTIDDGQYRYLLRYDVLSGHLRGTRNGRPFWAARQKVVRTEACPGFP